MHAYIDLVYNVRWIRYSIRSAVRNLDDMFDGDVAELIDECKETENKRHQHYPLIHGIQRVLKQKRLNTKQHT